MSSTVLSASGMGFLIAQGRETLERDGRVPGGKDLRASSAEG